MLINTRARKIPQNWKILRSHAWLSANHVSAAQCLIKKEIFQNRMDSWKPHICLKIGLDFVSIRFRPDNKCWWLPLGYQKPSFKIQVMNIQLQTSLDLCGLFTIAMAYDLCVGKDPCFMIYDESLMRAHLEQCFELERLSCFPRASGRLCKKMIYKEIVYCICRYPDVQITERFGHMVECDSCKQWYHQDCLEIPDSIFNKKCKSKKWTCSRCEF